MTRKHTRGLVTALGLVAGLTLAACADERPSPVYSSGVAYYPAPSSGTTYVVPTTGTTYYSPSTGMTYYTPSTVTTFSVPPCSNCDSNGAKWYRFHDGQWHID